VSPLLIGLCCSLIAHQSTNAFAAGAHPYKICPWVLKLLQFCLKSSWLCRAVRVVVAVAPEPGGAAADRAWRGARSGVHPREEGRARQPETEQHPAGRRHGALDRRPGPGPAALWRGRGAPRRRVGAAVREQAVHAVDEQPARPVPDAGTRREPMRVGVGGRGAAAVPGTRVPQEPAAQRHVGRLLLRHGAPGAALRPGLLGGGAVPVARGARGRAARPRAPDGRPHSPRRGRRQGGRAARVLQARVRLLRHGAQQAARHEGRRHGAREDGNAGCVQQQRCHSLRQQRRERENLVAFVSR
jgi:hypothetical protein